MATSGEPYPIRIDYQIGQGLDFSDFNATSEIKAPGSSDVFDLEALLGG